VRTQFLTGFLACSVALLAQEFEAASVKPANPDSHGTLVNFVPGGGLRVTNATLKDLIETAYQLRTFQIFAGRSWTGVTRYDVIASSGAPSNDDVRQKVQALLRDRFQLRVHNETRVLPLYSLVVAKNGIRASGLRTTSKPRRGINARRGAMIGEAAPMATLASRLSNELGRAVVNNTRLDGNYDFMLQWTPEPGPAPPDDQTAVDATYPSLFTALREQLGLRLEAARGPVEVIVIDHVEKPGDN
jgi:uncharacterized protein (TIGR03435 family)